MASYFLAVLPLPALLVLSGIGLVEFTSPSAWTVAIVMGSLLFVACFVVSLAIIRTYQSRLFDAAFRAGRYASLLRRRDLLAVTPFFALLPIALLWLCVVIAGTRRGTSGLVQTFAMLLIATTPFFAFMAVRLFRAAVAWLHIQPFPKGDDATMVADLAVFFATAGVTYFVGLSPLVGALSRAEYAPRAT